MGNQHKREKPLLERCAGNSLRLTNILTGQQIYAFCNRRRSCRRCAEYYRYCVARSLDTVQWQAHLVLTMKPGEDRPTAENLKHQAQCWQILASQLRKHFPRFYYAWFREVTKGGRLHLHVLWSIPEIDEDLLLSLSSAAGFGHSMIRCIKRPDGSPQLAVINYVTKGLAKIRSDADGGMLGVRRYQIAAPVKRGKSRRRTWLPSVTLH